jgi:hypothetical protein
MPPLSRCIYSDYDGKVDGGFFINDKTTARAIDALCSLISIYQSLYLELTNPLSWALNRLR